LHQSGRPRKTDDRGDRRIIRHLKCNIKQTLNEITIIDNLILPQAILSHTVMHRLHSCGFTRQKIRKAIVTVFPE